MPELKRKLVKKSELSRFGASTKAIVEAAWKKGIEVFYIHPKKSIFILKRDNVEKWYYKSRMSDDNRVGALITKDKQLTKELLAAMDVPTALGAVVQEEKTLLKEAQLLGYPVVVKPADSQDGKAVFVNICDDKTLRKSFLIANQYSENIMVEKFLPGRYYRFLVINKKFFAAAEARGATVVGNGKNTLAELIETENNKTDKGKNSTRKKIVLNDKAKSFLLTQKLTTQSIPPQGQEITLSFSGADGGKWTDVTDRAHPDNKKISEKIATTLNMRLIGVDIMSPNISKPLSENGGAVIEVNSAPTFDIHQQPTAGKPRPVAAAIIKMLFE
ncbi:hypothetical protein KJ903_05150 [Patescibacteria group bacterium]|nr:hypothetical protein [Patescibacteria group bacterium]